VRGSTEDAYAGGFASVGDGWGVGRASLGAFPEGGRSGAGLSRTRISR